MFGLSEEHVLTQVNGQEQAPEYDGADAVTLYHNQTDPTVIRDGVDRVSIVARGDDRYLVYYWGFLIGYLEVTKAGVAALGEHFLGDQKTVPRWILGESAIDGHPWWVPDDYAGTPTLSCDRCRSETSADEVLTPGSMDGEPDEMFCTDCWDEIGAEWHPGYVTEHESRLDCAEELYHEAQTSPATIDVAELYELTQGSDETTRWHALLALDELAKSRPGDVVDFVPGFETLLESPHTEVRVAAFRWFATIADEYPGQVTPVAATAVDALEVDADENVLEAAITIVSRVADDDPKAVVDAAPKIAALLQEDPPAESKAVLALARIAKAYPEPVLPVTGALLEYVETADESAAPSAIAALGHMSKEYPNVAESAIPTLLDLLDAESFYIRANAAGLLADLSDEYPDQLSGAIPRVAGLLEDEDEKARYNATSILARVAKAHPEAVEPVIGGLIDALDEGFEHTRSNACWALGYLEAEEAEPELERLSASDPSEEVRDAAQYALRQLD